MSPDITMCEGDDCPAKEKCHRYTVKPNELRQSYFRKPPFEIIHNKFSCAYFWEESADLLFEQLMEIVKSGNGRKRRNKKSGRK